MESFNDKLRAWVLAALVHLVVAALLLAGLFWTASTAKQVSLPGPVIEAELVGITAAPKPARATPQRPRPEPPKPEPPKPEPKPEPPTPPAPTRNDQMTREKVAELAQEKAEQAKHAQEEKQRQEQILLEQQERQRMKELEDIKRQRLAADRQAKLAAEKLKQLKDLQTQPAQQVPEAPAPVSGSNGQDTDLEAQYFAAIQNAVTQNWLRPDNAQPGLRCMLRIVQIPGGDVIGVQISSPCNADPQTRNSIEQAVKRAAPLPYKGYEKVFQRDINFNFTYDG